MAFQKGISGNSKGRKKGTPNKTTGDLREWINLFIDGNRSQIQSDWKLLEPKDRLIMFERLLKYTLPTLTATSLTTNFDAMDDATLDKIISKLQSGNDDQEG